jgi:hypothetical protein
MRKGQGLGRLRNVTRLITHAELHLKWYSLSNWVIYIFVTALSSKFVKVALGFSRLNLLHTSSKDSYPISRGVIFFKLILNKKWSKC